MSKILVTGATGNVGSRLVRLLASRGESVRALTHKGGQGPSQPGVESVNGDFTDKDSLRKAMNGVTKVFLLSAGADLELYEANALEAAKQADVELLVKQSVAGAQYKATLIPSWHRASEERIEASGVPYVFLRPASFASNALYWVATIKSQDTVYGTLGDTALPVIDPDDIADCAAEVLTGRGHAGKAYEISGPQSVTTQQQVDILSKILGRPLKYVNIPDSAAQEAMLGMGMQPRWVDGMIGLFETLRGIGRVEPNNGVQSLLGREPRTFEQWARANAGAFAPETAQTHA